MSSFVTTDIRPTATQTIGSLLEQLGVEEPSKAELLIAPYKQLGDQSDPSSKIDIFLKLVKPYSKVKSAGIHRLAIDKAEQMVCESLEAIIPSSSSKKAAASTSDAPRSGRGTWLCSDVQFDPVQRVEQSVDGVQVYALPIDVSNASYRWPPVLSKNSWRDISTKQDDLGTGDANVLDGLQACFKAPRTDHSKRPPDDQPLLDGAHGSSARNTGAKSMSTLFDELGIPDDLDTVTVNMVPYSESGGLEPVVSQVFLYPGGIDRRTKRWCPPTVYKITCARSDQTTSAAFVRNFSQARPPDAPPLTLSWGPELDPLLIQPFDPSTVTLPIRPCRTDLTTVGGAWLPFDHKGSSYSPSDAVALSQLVRYVHARASGQDVTVGPAASAPITKLSRVVPFVATPSGNTNDAKELKYLLRTKKGTLDYLPRAAYDKMETELESSAKALRSFFSDSGQSHHLGPGFDEPEGELWIQPHLFQASSLPRDLASEPPSKSLPGEQSLVWVSQADIGRGTTGDGAKISESIRGSCRNVQDSWRSGGWAQY